MIDFNTWANEVARIAATEPSDPNFSVIIPAMIDYAEGRIYRELNLLATRVTDETGTLTANNRQFVLPSSKGTFITVTGINIITPAGSTVSNGTRNSIPSMTRNLVDYIAATETAPTTPSVPSMYYMRDNATVIVGPAPDANYAVEVIGTIRPTPLSSTNPTTYLTTYLPDLFVAASMVFFSGFMRNFGSQADDPKMAMSWESQYATLFASANAEEVRKRYNDEVGN